MTQHNRIIYKVGDTIRSAGLFSSLSGVSIMAATINVTSGVYTSPDFTKWIVSDVMPRLVSHAKIQINIST